MIKVLIVEDTSSKTKKIEDLLIQKKYIEYDTADTAINCKKFLLQKQYDLLILDLLIPIRAGLEVNLENSLDILEELKINQAFKKPINIVGLTAYSDKIDDKIKEFNFQVISYETNSNGWELALTKILDELVFSKISHLIENKSEYIFDYAIIAALPKPELKQIHALSEWKEVKVLGDSTKYYQTELQTKDHKKIRIISAASNQMGMVAATDLTNKILKNFRPRTIIMGGIAAGMSGNFGDILIAESCYDYGNGKYVSTKKKTTKGEIISEVFQPDPRQIPVNSNLTSSLKDMQSNRTFLDQIKNEWSGVKPSKDLNIHFGTFASGAGVIASEKKMKSLKVFSRKLIGIDMEAYGVYYAAHNASTPKPRFFLSIKSISDNGGKSKSDRYQNYAAYTSAKFIYCLITETELFND